VDTTTVYQDILRDIQRLPIRDIIDIHQFLNPIDKEINEPYDTIEELVLSEF
jgi:hypothetical protein